MNDRPTGITILAWLHMLGGLLGILLPLIMPFIAPAEFEVFKITINSGSISRPISLVIVVLFGFVNVFAGLQMLQGKKWGWWLSIFYQFFDLVNSFIAYIIFPILTTFGAIPESSANHNHLHIDLGKMFSVFIIWYFFRQTVFDYFAFDEESKSSKFWVLVGLSILLLFSISFLMTGDIV